MVNLITKLLNDREDDLIKISSNLKTHINTDKILMQISYRRELSD
jgi:hypothetical protein